jgi:DNA replication protein DnaC
MKSLTELFTENIKSSQREISQRKMEDAEKFNVFCLRVMNAIVSGNSKGKNNLRILPEMEIVFNQIFMYLNRDPELENQKTSIGRAWNLDAGILLVGNYGTGKTLILNSIRQISNELAARGIKNGIKGKKTTAREITKAHLNSFEELNFILGKPENDLFIDELGDEPFSVKLYGTEENPVYNVLKEKLDEWDNSPMKPRLFITTNLTQAEIVKRYGERVWSRFVGAMNIVILGKNENAIDFRKL